MTTHHLKCENPWFDQIWEGKKTFEVRRATDREFEVDDYLVLYEYDKDSGEFSGRVTQAKVTSIYEQDIPLGFAGKYEDSRLPVVPGVIMSIQAYEKSVIAWAARAYRGGQFKCTPQTIDVLLPRKDGE